MSLEQAVGNINKKYGKGTLVKASDAKALVVRKFSTGSLALDVGLGGGFAEGRMIEIIGAFSSYKSSLLTKAIKSYLELGKDRRAVLIDTEKAFERKWFEFLGGDADRMYLSWPTSGEEAGDIICDLMKDHKGPFLIIIDSIASMEPQKNLEDKASVGDAAMGKHARLMSEVLRKMTALLNNDLSDPSPRVTMMFSNQIRMKIGMFVGNPETGTGGRAREFYMSQQLMIKKDELVTEQSGEGDNERKHTIGARMRWVVTKNKTGGPPNESGYSTFHNTYNEASDAPGGEFDNAADLMPYAFMYDLVKRNGNTWTYKSHKATGQNNFVGLFRSSPDLLNELYRDILACHEQKFSSKGTPSAEKNDGPRVVTKTRMFGFKR